MIPGAVATLSVALRAAGLPPMYSVVCMLASLMMKTQLS